MQPGIAFVVALIQSTIVSKYKMVGIHWIDPQFAMIEVQAAGSTWRQMFNFPA